MNKRLYIDNGPAFTIMGEALLLSKEEDSLESL